MPWRALDYHFRAMRFLKPIFLLLLAALCVAEAAAGEVLRVGILAFRPVDVTRAQWAGLPPLLEKALPGKQVDLVVLSYPEFDAAARVGALDFMLTNPEHFILLRNRHGVTAIATLVRLENDRPLAELSGVIFTRADRPDIATLDDLAGKTVAAVAEEALGGYMLGAWELEKRDIKVRYHFTGQPHDQVVDVVLAGKADAGFVRSGILEALAREGKLRLDSRSPLKILNPQAQDGFPLIHSTPRVPEFPFAASHNVDPETVRTVTRTLLAIESRDEVALMAQIAGFRPPADYTPVELLMLRLRAHPDELKQFTLDDVLLRYREPLVAAAFASILIVLLAVLLLHTNYRLRVAVNENQRLLASLQDVALHDPLTSLSNRRHLDDRLQLALAQARRSGKWGAMIYLDLDNFKPLNDTHGHALGDQLLCEAANRMREAVRGSDTVARLGGDEFVILAPELGDDVGEAESAARVLAEKLRLTLALPYRLYKTGGVDIEHRVTASIGLALFDGAADALEIVRRADEAMYAAKHAGRDQVAVAGRA
jgi:diguanylate cyclase (GGDEF)-like protein